MSQMRRRLKQYQSEIEETLKIFVVKNHEYGDAIAETGVLGAVTEIVGVAARLNKLVLKSTEHGRRDKQQIYDKLRDGLNYCVIGLMMLQDDNWEGKE